MPWDYSTLEFYLAIGIHSSALGLITGMSVILLPCSYLTFVCTLRDPELVYVNNESMQIIPLFLTCYCLSRTLVNINIYIAEWQHLSKEVISKKSWWQRFNSQCCLVKHRELLLSWSKF